MGHRWTLSPWININVNVTKEEEDHQKFGGFEEWGVINCMWSGCDRTGQ